MLIQKQNKKLQIVNKIFLILCICSFIAPPTIVIYPMNTSIIEFNELMSFCNASGQPRPTIMWRRKDKDVVFPPGEYLRLPNVSRDDTGLYECMAWNSVGNMSAQFNINVLCK